MLFSSHSTFVPDSDTYSSILQARSQQSTVEIISRPLVGGQIEVVQLVKIRTSNSNSWLDPDTRATTCRDSGCWSDRFQHFMVIVKKRIKSQFVVYYCLLRVYYCITASHWIPFSDCGRPPNGSRLQGQMENLQMRLQHMRPNHRHGQTPRVKRVSIWREAMEYSSIAIK